MVQGDRRHSKSWLQLIMLLIIIWYEETEREIKKIKIKMYKPQLGIGNHVMPLIKTKTPDTVIKLTQNMN